MLPAKVIWQWKIRSPKQWNASVFSIVLGSFCLSASGVIFDSICNLVYSLANNLIIVNFCLISIKTAIAGSVGSGLWGTDVTSRTNLQNVCVCVYEIANKNTLQTGIFRGELGQEGGETRFFCKPGHPCWCSWEVWCDQHEWCLGITVGDDTPGLGETTSLVLFVWDFETKALYC